MDNDINDRLDEFEKMMAQDNEKCMVRLGKVLLLASATITVVIAYVIYIMVVSL